MKYHNLKIWPKYFKAIWLNHKSFEVRLNDRDFKVGDLVFLSEFSPITKQYTGKHLLKQISFILHGGSFGIEENYCVLSLKTYERESI